MILVKTEAGHRVLKDRSVRLTPRQRSAFILFDGRRSVDEVLQSGVGVAHADIEELLALGLLAPFGIQPRANGSTMALAPNTAARIGAPAVAPPLHTADAANAPVVDPSRPRRSDQQRFKDAYPIATQLTGALGLRGLRLNLSVEGARNFEELRALAPKIRIAVGPEKAAPLDRALNDD